MTLTKKAQMIADMTEALALNVSVYDMVLYTKDGRNVPYCGYDGIEQQQSRTGLKRQIQTIRAELLELEKRLR